MKRKLILVIIMCFFFFTFTVNAETCDLSNIKLESIKLNIANGNAEELTEASINGKKITLDLKLYDPGDLVEYNLKVKNTSSDDFYFDEKSLELNTDYLAYRFTYDDNSNIIRAGTEKIIKLRVEYKNKVPTELLVNGSYSDTNKMTVNLSNKETINVLDTIKNPKTGDLIVRYLLVILILGVSLLIVFKNKKVNKYMILVIGIAVIIPITVYSLCKYDIEVAAKIQILSPVIYPDGKNKETVVTGDIVKIGTEEFYVVKHEGDNLVLLSHYNLKVGVISVPAGEEYNKIGEYTSSDPGYGLQSSETKGVVDNSSTYNGVLAYSYTNYWNEKVGTYYPGNYCPEYTSILNQTCAYTYDSNSNLKVYVDSYKETLEEMGVIVKEARILKLEEAVELGCDVLSLDCINAPSWVYETSYWLGSVENIYRTWFISSPNNLGSYYFSNENILGLRPVIII